MVMAICSVDQVATSASMDEHYYMVPYLASLAEWTGDQDEDVQDEARDQKQDFRGSTKVQADSAQGGKIKSVGFCNGIRED